MDTLLSYTLSIAFDIIIASSFVLYAMKNPKPIFMKYFYPFLCMLLLMSTYIRGTIFWWEANFFVTALYGIFILLIYAINSKQPVGERVAYSFLIPFLASHLWELPNHFLWQNWNNNILVDCILLAYELGICIFLIYILRAVNTSTNYYIFIPIAIITISLCYIGGNPTYYAETFLHSLFGNINRIVTIFLLLIGIKPKHL